VRRLAIAILITLVLPTLLAALPGLLLLLTGFLLSAALLLTRFLSLLLLARLLLVLIHRILPAALPCPSVQQPTRSIRSHGSAEFT